MCLLVVECNLCIGVVIVVPQCCILFVLLAMNDVRLMGEAHCVDMSYCKSYRRFVDNTNLCTWCGVLWGGVVWFGGACMCMCVCLLCI